MFTVAGSFTVALGREMDLRKRKHTSEFSHAAVFCVQLLFSVEVVRLSSLVCTAGSSSPSLEEPLLAPSQSEDPAESLPTSYSEYDSSARAMVPHSINRYNWEELWRSLIAGCVQSCAEAWSKSCLSATAKASTHRTALNLKFLCRDIACLPFQHASAQRCFVTR